VAYVEALGYIGSYMYGVLVYYRVPDEPFEGVLCYSREKSWNE